MATTKRKEYRFKSFKEAKAYAAANPNSAVARRVKEIETQRANKTKRNTGSVLQDPIEAKFRREREARNNRSRARVNSNSNKKVVRFKTVEEAREYLSNNPNARASENLQRKIVNKDWAQSERAMNPMNQFNQTTPKDKEHGDWKTRVKQTDNRVDFEDVGKALSDFKYDFGNSTETKQDDTKKIDKPVTQPVTQPVKPVRRRKVVKQNKVVEPVKVNPIDAVKKDALDGIINDVNNDKLYEYTYNDGNKNRLKAGLIKDIITSNGDEKENILREHSNHLTYDTNRQYKDRGLVSPSEIVSPISINNIAPTTKKQIKRKIVTNPNTGESIIVVRNED